MTVAELVAKLGLDVDRESWDRASHGIEQLKEGLEGVLHLVAADALKEGLERIVEGAVEGAVHVQHLAEELGITTDRVQELGFAAKSIGEQGFSVAMKTMMHNAYAASQGSAQSAAAFAKLGVRVHDAHGQLLPADKLLESIADGLNKVQNPTQRAALSIELFGRQGLRMGRILKEGSEGLRKQYEQAHRLGIMSQHMIELAEKEHDAQIEVNYATKTLQNSIAEKLLPAKTWLLEKTVVLIEWFTKLARETNIVKEVMAVLGAIITYETVQGVSKLASALGMTVDKMGLFLAAALVAWLAWDQVVVTLKGGHTELEALGDAIGGVYDRFLEWRSLNPIIDALVAPLRGLVRWLKIAKDFVLGLIMASKGEYSGLAAVSNEAADALGLPRSERGSTVVQGAANYLVSGGGVGAGGVVTPSPAATAAAANQVAATMGGVVVHQQINATPSQSPADVGEAAADAIGNVWDDKVEQTRAKLMPLLHPG